ncbi:MULTISPECIES: DUF2301 domain-containing membrane protein [Photobacterium]|uniref:Membrane protein n=1 Tax=Photobacterium ganghwense TaxID=320778 RepID=A0A0J1K059_9GAMM|nr:MULTISPECIES: DUF2301 domain-containing membrane protein [Photobacterium]KLV07857.1 membrane protein [Photobacterium ganghwense]PSU06953.1 hypothetical protein C9I92_14365 [Photobacterium ganghwense]QSV15705.1 hypothetical protein FH974_20775 [Photobacterium ganghwense]
MADPQIQCQLDAIDKLTVILYRSALTAGSGLMSVAAWENDFAATGLIMAALIATTTVHIYDKRFRWLILGSALFATLWQLSGLWAPLGLGAALFAFSALAVKEYYCFKLKVLLITPLVLAGFWAGLVLSIPQLMIACSMAGAILLAVAAFSKWRMPLHYDIGDKSRYEV